MVDPLHIERLPHETHCDLARKWGRANGFKGRGAGWVYDDERNPVCQGWAQFWERFKDRIIYDLRTGDFTYRQLSK